MYYMDSLKIEHTFFTIMGKNAIIKLTTRATRGIVMTREEINLMNEILEEEEELFEKLIAYLNQNKQRN